MTRGQLPQRAWSLGLNGRGAAAAVLPPSSHCQIPSQFQTFQVNVYRVLTIAAVVIENEMYVISHCNTHIYSHSYYNYFLCAKLVKNSFLAFFVSRTTILKAGTYFPRLFLFPGLFPNHSQIPRLFQVFQVSGHPALITGNNSGQLIPNKQQRRQQNSGKNP